MTNDKEKSATAVNSDRWEEQRAGWIMQRRMEDFCERYMPRDREKAAHFAADLHMLVRSIYAEASEPANKQLLEIMKRMPFVLPGVKP